MPTTFDDARPPTDAASPRFEPIGLAVIAAGQQIAREFDAVLAEAGASLPEWLVLVSLKGPPHGVERHSGQHEIGPQLATEGPRRAEILEVLERRGMVQRTGAEGEPGTERVELTHDGQRTFHRLLKAVVAYDRRLRAGVSDAEARALDDLLGRLRTNASTGALAVSDPTSTAPGGSRSPHATASEGS
jgi:MarR family transcriptional regulator for hemolysin